MPATWEELTEGFTAVDVVLWVLGWGALFLYLLPLLVTAMGWRFVRFAAEEDPAKVEPDGTNPDYDRRYAELTALGFRPAGVITEHVWAHQHSLHKSFPVRYLVSADGLTYAALYGLWQTGMVRVALSTLTRGGVFIQTAMPGAGLTADEPDHRRSEVPWGPVEGLLAEHRAAVAEYARRGDPAVRATLAERAAADERITLRQLRGIGNGFVSYYPAVGWLLPFVAVLGLLRLCDPIDWPLRVGIAQLVAGVAYPLFAFKLMPGLHRWAERLEAAEQGEA